EGYRPKDGKFVLEPGIFKVFCERARENKDKKYILIIDEINRGNLSKIFGELLYLLEYRDKEIRLTYSQDKFSIPENVYIIGTMNTADRSLAIMDYALRRRFYFVDIVCKTKRLEKWLTENGCTLEIGELIGAIENMNKAINDEMHSKDFAIGHSYFMREDLDEKKLEEIINYGVKPLLGEYFFDKDEKVDEITGIMNNFFKKKIIEKIQE
ncbi:MAG: AAA family ATPase, partial [Candidatus Atribacteria bacterium]|nr:AAA family ATPase [Candidatus Atribacteria bacterium]